MVLGLGFRFFSMVVNHISIQQWNCYIPSLKSTTFAVAGGGGGGEEAGDEASPCPTSLSLSTSLPPSPSSWQKVGRRLAFLPTNLIDRVDTVLTPVMEVEGVVVMFDIRFTLMTHFDTSVGGKILLMRMFEKT